VTRMKALTYSRGITRDACGFEPVTGIAVTPIERTWPGTRRGEAFER
jgi:hypothetical protein